MVSEQIEESLRREIESYIESRLSGIKHEIAQLQTQLDESLKRVLEGEGEAHWDGSLAATVAEHLHAAHERGVELAAAESARSQASSDMAIIKAAVEEIEGQHSQAEILKTLVNRASSFAPRVVFFLVKGDQARGWRARGLEGTVGDDAVQQIAFELSADTMVGEVVKSRATWSGTPNTYSDDHLLLNRLSEQAPNRIVAVPLVVRGRAVAVLYADSAGLDAEAINLEALETLVRVAGMAVTLLSASQAKAAVTPAAQPVARREPEVAASGAPSSYEPVRVYEPPAPVEAVVAETPREVAAPVHYEAALPAPAVVAEPERYEVAPAAPQEVAEPERYEIAEPAPAAVAEPVSYEIASPVYQEVAEPERYEVAEPVPQAVVTEEPAIAGEEVDLPTAEPFSMAEPLPVEPAAPPAPARRRYGSYDVELPIAVLDEDEKRQHNDARRFARLLVSEIKLYNEQKVIEGRTQGNLYERLREYIDRSREMYDKRVKPGVSGSYDYFHHELVNTLAEGDASKLGAAYPGTTVSA